jgi:AGCS family alanine or glycine:cation symporter
VGAIASMGLVWNIADLLQGLMVIINIPVILLLIKPAVRALEDYQKQRAEGKDPEFHAADIGLEGKTEFWQ